MVTSIKYMNWHCQPDMIEESAAHPPLGAVHGKNRVEPSHNKRELRWYF